MNILKFKGYEGTAELDMDEGICRGKILFINDLITYQSDSPKTLQHEFEAAVEDYLETCADLDRSPQKPLKGQFNVRISPELHKAATVKAMSDDTSLNDIVGKAIDSFVNTNPKFRQAEGSEFVSAFKTEIGELLYSLKKEDRTKEHYERYLEVSSKKEGVRYVH